jgi:hypothetical protein
MPISRNGANLTFQRAWLLRGGIANRHAVLIYIEIFGARTC